MGLFSRPKRIPDPTDGHADFIGHVADTPILINDPRLPEQIRAHALRFGAQVAQIHRMETDQGIEWWLMDSDGELLDAISYQ